MKQGLRFCCLLLLSLSVTTLFAQPEVNPNNFWQCTARDGAHRQWTATSNYQKIALNFAYNGCKKQSTIPTTCSAPAGSCERFINGISRRPMWKCTAIDQMAEAWRGDLYTNREEAALAAKDYCRSKSEVPGTCYINLITCVNVNELIY